MGSIETDDDQLWRIEARAVGAGAVTGFLAGIVMGFIFQFGTDLMPVFGALAGRTSLLRGWLVHLITSSLYGVLFAVILAYPPIQSFMESFDVVDYLFVGVTFAIMIAAVTVTLLSLVLALPWTTSASRPPFTNVPGIVLSGLIPAAMFGIGHIVYGGILGVGYVALGETRG